MTKKILLVLSVILVLISCNKAGENEYIVTGTIKGIDNGKTVTLEVQDEKTGQLKAVDTVKIENGKFVFKGSAKEPELYLVQVEKVQGKVPFILRIVLLLPKFQVLIIMMNLLATKKME